jgi:uncharacterized integral membrane protein
MVRIALLLLVVAVFVILVLSNFSPIALTFLGTTTQALPLGVWVVGAMLLGGLTTLLISGGLRLVQSSSGTTPRSRSAHRTTHRATNRPADNAFRAPWGGAPRPATGPTPSPNSSSSSTDTRPPGDDWETSQQSRDQWNDWGEAPDLSDRQAAYSNTPVRDTADDDWANWDDYDDLERSRRSQPDELDDEEPSTAPPPRRTEFEARQAPESQRQSGSVYSYSYRRSDDDSSKRSPETKPPAKSGEVYDAEYRVITPPYRPEPEDTTVQPPSAAEEDDWGFDEDEWDDRPKA